jgi:N-acetylneuraminate synthase/N,N'-diacetyllegionaminate synthase
MNNASFRLGGRVIGGGAATFVIAEAGVNHNGDLSLARRLVAEAATAGVDAVKFQTFRAAALVTPDAPKAAYQSATTGDGGVQRDMLAPLELSREAHRVLRDDAVARGMVFFSSPFDEASADLLEALEVELFKVPSGEITNLGLLRHVAAKGRPIVLSTGMSTVEEIEAAVHAVRDAGNPPLALLHCVSAYPAPAEETNLKAMDALRERFGCVVGLSDHTTGIEVAIAAVARGAAIIEKHFTVDKTLPGPDHRASLDLPELTALVRAVRRVEAALGDGVKRCMPCELDTRRVARKSLVAARPLRPGERLTREAIAVKRPGTGISPADLERVIGRTVARALSEDEVIEWTALSDR